MARRRGLGRLCLVSVDWWSVHMRRVAAGVVVVLAASFAVAVAGPASAGEPGLPAGATAQPPQQRTGSAAGRGHEAPTGVTQPRRGASPAADLVPGAVGPEAVHPIPLFDTG